MQNKQMSKKEATIRNTQNKKNLDPTMHPAKKGNTVEMPTAVDAELLSKVLSNPEMAALLTALAKTIEDQK